MTYRREESIPEGWEYKQIKEIGEVVGGGTPKTTVKEYWNGDISWITPKDLSNYKQRYIYKGERSITLEGLENSSAKLLPKGTVLFSSRAPIGYVAIAGKELCTNQGFKSIVCNPEVANNEFVYYLMKYNVQEIKQIASGSTFREISGGMLKEFYVLIPPLEEQKVIAKILADLDKKIEINNKIIKKLEKLAQAIFKHWFIDFEFPNENGEPYKSSGGEMVESDMGLIPKGWNVVEFSKIIQITSGKRPKKRTSEYNRETPFPLVGASSIMGYTDDYNYDEPILIIGRVGTHGVVQRFNKKVWASDNTLVIKTKFYEYVYQILQLIDYRSLNRGSTQPLITQKDIKNYKILLPQETVLNKFENLVSNLFKLRNKNLLENEKLVNLRDLLLPKLMSGEIRVPVESD